MSFSTPEQVASDIARELTADPGAWNQGDWAAHRDGGGLRHCLSEHIYRRTSLSTALRFDTVAAYKTAIGKHERLEDPPVITDWNDRASTTVADIIAVSQRVAGQS